MWSMRPKSTQQAVSQEIQGGVGIVCRVPHCSLEIWTELLGHRLEAESFLSEEISDFAWKVRPACGMGIGDGNLMAQMTITSFRKRLCNNTQTSVRPNNEHTAGAIA